MISDAAGGTGGQDVYVSRRTGTGWGPLQSLGPKINSSANDYCAFVTPDGHTILFLSNRAGGLGLGDFYVSFRRNAADDTAWDDARLVTELNSSADEFGPSGFEDPATGVLTIFFNSTRPGGPGGQDIYTADLRPDGTFSTPRLVEELSTSANDTWPSVRPDGLEMFLVSNRPGTLGGNDIWVASRGSLTESWSTPMNLGPTVNTASSEGRAFPYADGTRLVFFSNRAGGAGGNDVYETSRTRTTVVPVVGSVIGAGGATFRTSAQISNPTGTPITGSLIFHRAGQGIAASDPRIAYALGAYETRNFADLMASFGTTGLGWLEVSPLTGAAPAVSVRIDNGGSIIVPQVRSDDVLRAGSPAVLVVPNLELFRMNVGVNTQASGATISTDLYGATGTLIRTSTRTFAPNDLVHLSAAALVGAPIATGQTLVIRVTSGSAVVYASTVASDGHGSTFQIAPRQVQ